MSLSFNKTYKHIYNTDIAFVPLNLTSESEESLTFYGRWVNICLSTPGHIDYDTITIKKTDIDNWKEFNLDESKV